MAGAKKKKSKPAANPARGFATTSVASKPRVETTAPAQAPPNPPTAPTAPDSTTAADPATATSDVSVAPSTVRASHGVAGTRPEPSLSPEEFERQLEESELQLLVEKHAERVRRDAVRQRNRLDTDRRLLRVQAEPLNTRKWLPQELMDQILDLIQAETRFAASSLASERPLLSEKRPSEEDLTMKLWTLQQTLESLSFSSEKVEAVLQYVLELVPGVSGTSKDYIWGLEEALDWLARSCTREELRDYDYKGVRPSKSQPGMPIVSHPIRFGAVSPDCVRGQTRRMIALYPLVRTPHVQLKPMVQENMVVPGMACFPCNPHVLRPRESY